MKNPGAVIYRSRHLADLQETKFSANRNTPNCSIAFTEEGTPASQPSQKTLFLLRDPNYKLFRDSLTARKRGAWKAGRFCFKNEQHGDSGAILLRKTNMMGTTRSRAEKTASGRRILWVLFLSEALT